MIKRPNTRATLAGNVNSLMARKKWVQMDLAKASGVSQRAVSNICNPQGPSPTLKTVDAVASAFNLEGWHLIMPSLLSDLDNGSSIAALLRNYDQAEADGKRHILRIAEREAEFHRAGNDELTK